MPVFLPDGIKHKRDYNHHLTEYGFHDPINKNREYTHRLDGVKIGGMEKMTEDKIIGNKPKWTVSAPTETKDNKVYWCNIGSAWEGDKGISITLNAHPIGSKLMLFPYQEKR